MVNISRNVVRIVVNLLALIAFIIYLAAKIFADAGIAVEQSTRIFNIVSPILMTLIIIHILHHRQWFKKLPRTLKNL